MSKSNYNSGKNGRRFNPAAKIHPPKNNDIKTVFGDDMTWETPKAHETELVEVMASVRKCEALRYVINMCLDHKNELSQSIFNTCVTNTLLTMSGEEKDALVEDYNEQLREFEAVTQALEQLYEIFDELRF